MITQTLQFMDLLSGNFRYLILFFLFVTLSTLFYSLKAKTYNPYKSDFWSRTSAIVPVYKEHPNMLRTMLKCLRPQVNQLIVVADEATYQEKRIIKRYATHTIFNRKKIGKRRSLAMGLKLVRNKITVLVDSDVIVNVDSINKLIKPFSDSSIGLVQGRCKILNDTAINKVSVVLSKLTENVRDVVCKCLNGNMIVVDGRLQAVRTSLFKQISYDCITDKFLGKKMISGDDRQRTRLINRLGFNTVYQSTATCNSVAQPTLTLFLKQQLRWIRSGYIYFFKDIFERNIPSLSYLLKSCHYYLSPFLFLSVTLLDIMYPMHTSYITLWMIPLIFLLGVITITFLRQAIMFGMKKIEYKWLPVCGLYGIFIGLPLMLYGVITMKKACVTWETR